MINIARPTRSPKRTRATMMHRMGFIRLPGSGWGRGCNCGCDCGCVGRGGWCAGFVGAIVREDLMDF